LRSLRDTAFIPITTTALQLLPTIITLTYTLPRLHTHAHLRFHICYVGPRHTHHPSSDCYVVLLPRSLPRFDFVVGAVGLFWFCCLPSPCSYTFVLIVPFSSNSPHHTHTPLYICDPTLHYYTLHLFTLHYIVIYYLPRPIRLCQVDYVCICVVGSAFVVDVTSYHSVVGMPLLEFHHYNSLLLPLPWSHMICILFHGAELGDYDKFLLLRWRLPLRRFYLFDLHLPYPLPLLPPTYTAITCSLCTLPVC